MESCSKPETVRPGLDSTSAMSGPLLSDPLHGETDSFLTAARLVRRGWSEEGKKTGWQYSHFDRSVRQPALSRSDGNQGPKRVEICLKVTQRGVAVVNSMRTAEDRETGSEKKTDEAKQTTEGAFLANRQIGRQTGLCSQAGVVCVWGSGCRTTYKQSRRFKAPILPVIAEM